MNGRELKSLKKDIAKKKKEALSSKESAINFLIELGMLTPNGKFKKDLKAVL